MSDLLDPVGDPQQGQFAQRAEVAGAEVVGQRGVDPLGRVDVAVGHPAADRLGRHVDELELVGPPDDVVGHGFALRDPGDLGDHVVERLEVLDVERRDRRRCRRRAAARRPASASRCATRARWCGRTRRRARPAGSRAQDRRRRPSRSSTVPRYSTSFSGNHLEIADLLGGLDPAVRLDDADHDVGAAARCGGRPRRASCTSCRRRAMHRGRCGASRGPSVSDLRRTCRTASRAGRRARG